MFVVRILAVLLLTLPTLSSGEVIIVPIAQQGSDIDHIARPTKGTSKASVLQQFGEPLQRMAARGEPPISSWQYAEFTVYFEYEHVIHSVLKHRPKNLPAATAEPNVD
ncbi:MAG: phosphodiesterase [Pseudomonadales bacterium]